MEDLKIYTTDEVIGILKINRRTLYNYIKGGQLNGFKVGKTWRFTEAEIKRFIKDGIEKSYTEKLKKIG